MRYYDPQQRRLIYLDVRATPQYWDEHWLLPSSDQWKLAEVKNTFVSRETIKYLHPKDGYILEGGCGRAQHVSALVANGFTCIGIDSAPETIQWVNKSFPALDVRLGDVRQLEFPDGFFTGYWSIGLIEHFWDGYTPVLHEAARIIRPRGFFFVTFPYISPLRKWKVLTRQYPFWQDSTNPVDFYQFALDHRTVIEDVTQYGFKLKSSHPFDGIKGLKSEVHWLHQPLQNLYDLKSQSLLMRGFRAGLSNLLALLSGHAILLVFQRLA